MRFFSISTILFFTLVFAAHSQQVTICHYPPGNPANCETIDVGVNAVPDHLDHGDHLGECEDDCSAFGGYDYDNDGIVDDLDNCPGIFNPDQADTDGDSHGNLCDIGRVGDRI